MPGWFEAVIGAKYERKTAAPQMSLLPATFYPRSEESSSSGVLFGWRLAEGEQNSEPRALALAGQS